MSVRSRSEQTERVCPRVHTLRAARNKHDWTCTVPWPVFQLCVRTLRDDHDNDTLGMVIEQTSGDPCAMARVSSKQATHALEQKLETSNWKVNDKKPKPRTT